MRKMRYIFIFLISSVVFINAQHPPLTLEEEIVKEAEETILLFEREQKVYFDPVVDRVGNKVASFANNPNLKFTFKVVEGGLNSLGANAFAFPTGDIYITSGLLELIENDDELAFIMGHEIAHVVLRHTIYTIQENTLATLCFENMRDLLYEVRTPADKILAFEEAVSVFLTEGITLLDTVSREEVVLQPGFINELTRYREIEADVVGCIYAVKAGYKPKYAISILKKMRNIFGDTSIFDNPGYLLVLTHPTFTDRIGNLEAVIEKMQ
jgi:predicted Zn-dependent protease